MQPHAVRVYLVLQVLATFAATGAFSTVTIYRYTVGDLSPFELVLVGTAMEAAVFFAEIPTGVVADVVSRKLSIVIGHVGMGIGMIAEGLLPAFWPILLAQVFWGVSYTFTSGATQAWLAGEVGEESFGDVILRGAQFTYPTALVATVVGFAAATQNLQAPLVMGGVISIALGLWLVVAMPESMPPAEATSDASRWRSFARTTREGVASVTRRRALLLVAMAILLWGAASEAFDRLMQPHLIDVVGVPAPSRGGDLGLLGALSVASLVVGYLVTTWARRRRLAQRSDAFRFVVILALVEVVATGGLALAPTYALGAAAVLAVTSARSLRGRLVQAWIVPLTEPRTRATALSVLGQADAAGQSLVGPAFGAIGTFASLRAAFVASAGVLAVAPPLVLAAARDDHRQHGRDR